MFNTINLILFIISTTLLIFIIKKENFLKIVNEKYNNLLESIGIKTEETISDNNFFKPFRDNLEFNKDNYETYRSNTNAMKYDKLIKYL